MMFGGGDHQCWGLGHWGPVDHRERRLDGRERERSVSGTIGGGMGCREGVSGRRKGVVSRPSDTS